MLLAWPVAAETAIDPFLSCSAEFLARAEYNQSLGLTNSGHIAFLTNYADLYLRIAESRAPQEVVDCAGGLKGALVLGYCLGPADLSFERQNLVLDRLTTLAEQNGPNYPLPICIEDDLCGDCLRLLDRALGQGPKSD